MGRRAKKAIAVFVVGLVALFAVSQLIGPERTNPSTDSSQTIKAYQGSSALVAVLDRSCNDCHSNTTDWSRYTKIAPVSWIVTYSVNGGRKVLNFSEWGRYTALQQHALLTASCNDARQGTMPGSTYTMLRPEARLSPQDIEIICAAARAEAGATTSSIRP